MIFATIGISDIEAVADRHDERIAAHAQALNKLAPKLSCVLVLIRLDVQAVPEVISDLLAVVVNAKKAHCERVGLV